MREPENCEYSIAGMGRVLENFRILEYNRDFRESSGFRIMLGFPKISGLR